MNTGIMNCMIQCGFCTILMMEKFGESTSRLNACKLMLTVEDKDVNSSELK